MKQWVITHTSSTEPSVSPSGTSCLPLNPAVSLPLSPLCYSIEGRKAERKLNFNSCAPFKCFSSPSSPDLDHVRFPLLFGKGEAQQLPAGCLTIERLILNNFYECKTKSSTFMDTCAIQPTWKLKLQSRVMCYLCPASKDTEQLFKRKKSA